MDVSAALKELSEPHSRDEKITAIIARSAHLAGLTYSRCFEIWYARARRIEQAEIARISDALEKKREREARNELQELRTRLAKLEARLLSTDEDFYRPQIDFLGRSACVSS